MEERNKVIKMYRGALRHFFEVEDRYSCIAACAFKRVLKEAFGMSEEELKEIEDTEAQAQLQ